MTRVLVFLLCFSTSVAAAQPPTPQVVEFEGVPGLWFPEADARRMLNAWREREQLTLRVPILEAMVANRNQRVEDLERALSLSRETTTELLSSNRRLSNAATPHWWTSPYLWLVIGLVAGGTIVTLNSR